MDNDKIVLINPPVYDFAAFDLWAKPFGLLLIASYLKENSFQIKFIDAMDPFHPLLEGLPSPKRKKFGIGKFFEEFIPKPAVFKDVRRKFRRFGLPASKLKEAMRKVADANFVFVTSAMTYWYLGAFEAIALAKEIFPKAKIVLGGIYATLCADHARKFSGADFVIAGSWEKNLAELAEILNTPLKPLSAPLFQPALELYHQLGYAPIMLSRGCPFRCAYCASWQLFDTYVIREVEDVLEEMEKSISRGVTDFAFYDDALLWNAHKGIIPLLETVLSKGYKVRFHAPNGMHISKVDKYLASLMKRAGFQTIRLGVETLSHEKHERWGRKADPSIIAEVAEAFFSAGFDRNEVGAYLLAGLPGQKAEELEKDIKTLLELGINPYLAEYTPIPGTPMFEEAKKFSRYNLEEEPLTHNNSVLPCAWEGFTCEDLQRLKQLTWHHRHAPH